MNQVSFREHFRSEHSHKKRKGSLETRAVLLVFSLGLKISGVVVQPKIVTFVWDSFVKMTLRLFQPFSVVITMVPRVLRQFKRSLQIKKSIANAPCVL